MRYQLELDLDLPRDRAVALFLDPDALPKWQPDLVSIERLSDGDPRDVGARSRQVHRMGKREITMVETITVRDDPDRYAATYEADKVWNLVENRFVDLGDGRTKWIVDATFKCSGFVALIAFFLPGMFKKQTATFMKRFKDYAEASGG